MPKDPSFQIRPLDPDNIKTMHRFLVDVFGDVFAALADKHLKASFSTEDTARLCFLACWQDGAIVGACAISEAAFTCGTWGLGWVGVDAAWRHKGIGTALVQAAIEGVADRIAERATLILSVTPSVAPFYRKMGFDGATLDHEGNPFLTRAVDPASRLA